jgi:hypothetical protein
VATVAQCDAALHELAARLDAHEPDPGNARFDRTLSCLLRDLDALFVGRLTTGRLVDIHEADEAERTEPAQIRLEMSSDDLLQLVAGELSMSNAWAAGRVRVHAGVRDMLRLRSLF